MTTKKGTFIALYLPQYYPTKENDEWWGPGFTDWRTINTAKPLFHGHIQPKVPADLGYYDLRLEETRIKQADLAKKYGIDAFCYWHYWFGGGKRLLDLPFTEVLESGRPDFPFCLGWANHSWYKKDWGGKGKNKLLIEQKYLGIEDYTLHFMTMLPAFKDKRYLRHEGKLVFLVYEPTATPEMKLFISTWRKCAKENNLGDFFFIGKDFYSQDKSRILDTGFDAIYNDNIFAVVHYRTKFNKALMWLKKTIFRYPYVIKYKDAARCMLSEEERNENVCPVIAPNWDHSPRSGMANPIFVDTQPKYFQKLVKNVCDLVRNKKNDIVIVQSWNEWGEGNYLEPDMKYGCGMLEALRSGREV